MRSRGLAAALGGAGATLGAAAAWYQLFQRPQPKQAGRIRVAGPEGAIEIARDRFGVPAIRAGSVADLCFGNGFCHGQDRLWGLELYRRVASGRTAEFAGSEGLVTDRPMRVFGFRAAAEREAAALAPDTREMLECYAAGVNAAVEVAPALPFELQLLRLHPEPWTPADSLVLGKLIALGFSTNMEAELHRADLIRRLGPELAARLEPRYPAGNPVASTPGVGWSGDAGSLVEQVERLRAAIGLAPQAAGSNNWVVSGEHSQTGKPLLAGDPHVTATIPDLFYAVELYAPGIELRGAAIPGTPGVMVGQTPHVAWSFTNVLADVQDLFVERVREGAGAAEYEFEGAWRPLVSRREEIAVKGAAAEVIEVRETHHGPIVNDAFEVEGEPLALAWTALHEPVFTRVQLDCGRARSGAELMRLMSDFAVPCMNALWADSGGNIGYKLIGRLPKRRGNCPDLPRPGWTGQFEWEGCVPYEELPEIVNPECGVLVTANNQIAPDDYPHHITSDYYEGYRAERIEILLAERERHSLDDFARMQTDLYSIPGKRCADKLAALDATGERERRALDLLRDWDGRLVPDTVAGTIQQVFLSAHFARAVSEAIIGDVEDAERWRARSRLTFTSGRPSDWRWLPRLLELWEEGDEQLIGGRSWDELALAALGATLDELERGFGADPAGWTWGRVHGLRFPHPLATGEGRLAERFERLLSRRLEAGGAAETVCQVAYVPYDGDYSGTVGAGYRLLADLEDPRRSRWQHMTGQSGHPQADHYDDLLEGWLAGTTNPVAQPAENTLTLEPQ